VTSPRSLRHLLHRTVACTRAPPIIAVIHAPGVVRRTAARSNRTSHGIDTRDHPRDAKPSNACPKITALAYITSLSHRTTACTGALRRSSR
jgi:hypothetical protein